MVIHSSPCSGTDVEINISYELAELPPFISLRPIGESSLHCCTAPEPAPTSVHTVWKSNCNFRIASLFGSYFQLIACPSPTLGIDTRCSQTKYGSYQSSL